MQEEVINISTHRCHIISGNKTPQIVLVKPLGSFEWKCLLQECQLIAELCTVPFVLCAFEVDDMDSFRHPDTNTFNFLTEQLTPYLRLRFGQVSLVLGGYSLGGLFALWCSTLTDEFQAIAACSPSLWAAWWHDHALLNPPKAQYVYLSVGDTEEHTRKEPFCHMGNALRQQHQLLLSQLDYDHCTLEWNPGGHFNQIEIRKAKGFAWCINHLIPCQQ